MDPINSAVQPATQAAQAVQAGQTPTAAGIGQTASAPSGLPPVNLAHAASANTVNAALVSSQWGIDPAAVGGVFGGAAAESGGLFSGDNLLPLLNTLHHATAEQALSMIGIERPAQSGEGAAAAYSAGAATSATAIADAAQQSALAQAGAGSSAGTMVDPLWGRAA
jgi:hypothetical protein